MFNCINFDDDEIPDRTGAEEDSEEIEATFASLGKYDIRIHTNYTSKEILETFQKIRIDYTLIGMDSLIIFISSHGKSRYEFYTKDGIMNINDLRSLLVETHKGGCLYLLGKPKIFLANYCQGEAMEEGLRLAVRENAYLSLNIEEGGEQMAKIAVPRNIKTFFSASEGVVAWRKPEGGNYFIQTFCKVLQSNPKLELQQIIYKTNQEVEAELKCKSTFSEEGSRFNHFYF